MVSWEKPKADTAPMHATTPSQSGEVYKINKSIVNSEHQHHDIFGTRGLQYDGYKRPESKNLSGFPGHRAT